MILAFIIWSIAAIIFIIIGISAWNSEQAVGFFTFSKPPKVNNVEKYNHAVGKLWFWFASVLEIIGLPLLCFEQNSPFFIPVIFGVMLLTIAIMLIYIKIERKYRQT